MKKGLGRFEFWLRKVEILLLQSATEKNPGLWLYANDLRTPLFMLEGLAKMHAGMHNGNRFSKMKEDFKLLEDALGTIDYYDSFGKEFLTKPNIPEAITEYIQAQTREKIQRLNDLLQQRSWVGENADRIKKIGKKLKDADWMKEEDEVNAIAGFYKYSIDEINSFIGGLNYKFTEIETQVHALRRKLRWLSIYPKALQGTIQLTDHAVKDDNLAKYLTEDILNSPFIKMPDAGDNRYFLMLEKNYFLSLSSIISTLGKLKDSGLRVIAVTEAIQQIRGIGRPEALATAYQVLGEPQPNITSILSQSSATCETYFKEKNLEKLVSGVSTIQA